jgi:hypothetical protein
VFLISIMFRRDALTSGFRRMSLHEHITCRSIPQVPLSDRTMKLLPNFNNVARRLVLPLCNLCVSIKRLSLMCSERGVVELINA